MQGYQERYVYFWPNHHKNTVAYIQILKSSLSHPLFYQSRSMQGVISKNYLNFVTILSNIAQSQKSNFLSYVSDTFNTNLFLSLYGANKSEGCVVMTGAIDTCQTTICQMILKEPNNKNHSESMQDCYIYESKRIESILQN